jgi:2'-5' RNA ligase
MAKRLFAAVAVAASEALRELAGNLRRELGGERIRWDRLEHPHATLWFFGPTAEERIPELQRALATAAAQVPAFTMKIRGVGAFAGARHPTVIWLGLESATGLGDLFAAMAARLGAIGWQPEKREFRPHLTLGRISALRDARRFAETLERYREVAVQDQAVTELILYESLLRPGGAEHVPLGRYALSGRPKHLEQ